MPLISVFSVCSLFCHSHDAPALLSCHPSVSLSPEQYSEFLREREERLKAEAEAAAAEAAAAVKKKWKAAVC